MIKLNNSIIVGALIAGCTKPVPSKTVVSFDSYTERYTNGQLNDESDAFAVRRVSDKGNIIYESYRDGVFQKSMILIDRMPGDQDGSNRYKVTYANGNVEYRFYSQTKCPALYKSECTQPLPNEVQTKYVIDRRDGPAIIHRNGTKKWYYLNRLHRTNGPAIERSDGTKEWYVNGKRHRQEKPAVIKDNNFIWYYNGKKTKELTVLSTIGIAHFAVELKVVDWLDPNSKNAFLHMSSNGTFYYKCDRQQIENASNSSFLDCPLHRENDPAVKLADGSKMWYIDGELYRENGPAIEMANGYKNIWMANGKLHREGEPAVIGSYSDDWFLNGVLQKRKMGNGDILYYGKEGEGLEVKAWGDSDSRSYYKCLQDEATCVNDRAFASNKYFLTKKICFYGTTIEYNADGIYNADGPVRDDKNNARYYRNGKLHREDGPAIEWADGSKTWFRNGELHRTNGPAKELAGGRLEWYENGKLKKVKLPDGTTYWYGTSGLSIEDGKWFIAKQLTPYGTTIWYNSKGEVDRTDGPIVYDNGDKAWYKNGKQSKFIQADNGTVVTYNGNGYHVEWPSGDKKDCITIGLVEKCTVYSLNGNKGFFIDNKVVYIIQADGVKVWFNSDGNPYRWDYPNGKIEYN